MEDSHDKRMDSFMPGHVLFFVKHEPGLSPQQILDSVERLIAPILREKEFDGFNVNFNSKRVVSIERDRASSPFNKGSLKAKYSSTRRLVMSLPIRRRVTSLLFRRKVMSLIGANTTGTGADEKKLMEFIKAVNTLIGKAGRTPITMDPKEPIIREHGPHVTANLSILAESTPVFPEVTLMVASPNWFTTAAQQHTPTGGPGGSPVEAEPPPVKYGHKFSLPIDGTGAGVCVAILDTAPTEAQLAQAQANPSWEEHPILTSLLGDQGKLTPTNAHVLYPAPELINQLNHYPHQSEPLCHQYSMVDHGTFVAGIINTIAPDASLYLIQVLNDFGVGTFETFVHGIKALEGLKLSGPLLVNCSLTINLPREDHPEREEVEEILSQQVSGPLETVEQGIIDAMQEIYAWLEDHRYPVMAAAGNDTRSCLNPNGEQRLSARYPAAHDRIIGIGALETGSQQVAHYSNEADTPTRWGVVTFGGSVINGQVQPDQGIRGIYMSDTFPNGAKNVDGWAWWAGTSFATAIATGALARLREQHPNKTSGELLDEFYGYCSGEVQQTEEAVFVVNQV